MESPSKINLLPPEAMETDFVWEDYLEDSNSKAAPPTAFTHVEYSLESGFKVGMKLEIPSSDDGSTYWVASVIMTCGELLSLRFAGYEDDRSADFWFNIKSGDCHPLGWCSANNKKLWPPKGVLEKCPDVSNLISEELKSIDAISSSLSEDLSSSFMPIDQIKTGMKLEVLEEFNPQWVWIATIEQNVGGRLLLKYDGVKDTSHNFWLFYLSDKLQVVGYGKEHNLIYSPPKNLKCHDIDWASVLDISFKEAKQFPFPVHIFEPKLPIEMHEFKEGLKLEAVNPYNYTDVCPATISKVVNDFYFIVTIDDYEIPNSDKNSLCCHSNSSLIFPIRWAEENNVDLKVPKGYKTGDTFSWDDYLEFCDATPAAPDLFQMGFMNMGFENGMKCEAVDPFSPNLIKAATIVNVVEPLMWLVFDSDKNDLKSLITSVTSFDIYPVGWCGSNYYPLQIPASYKPKVKVTSVKSSQIEKQSSVSPQLPVEIHGKSWCPKIYFNHRCFTGPLLSKSRLAELPQAIGPGPVSLVLHEVISRVVNIAYKSSQVLQILQTTGRCNPAMQQQVIKAKYKGKSYRAIIEIVRNTEQVESFCKKICSKLECCPYLFGPTDIIDTCPSNCHTQTKTKFGYHFVKKQQKKVGRPPLNNNSSNSSTTEEVVKRGPGRRKKRKHWTHLLQTAVKNALRARQENENNEWQEDADDTDGCDIDVVTTHDNDKEELNVGESDKSVNKEKSLQSVKSENQDNITEVTQKYKDGEMCQSHQSKSYLSGKKKLKHTPSSSIVTRGAKLPNFGLWHHVSSFHNRRGRPRTRPIVPFPNITGRKVGRPVGSTKKAIAQLKAKRLLEMDKNLSSIAVEVKKIKPVLKVPKVESSPLEWSVEEVVKYVQKTDCAPVAPLLKDQEIDGQAFLMLTKHNVQEFLHLKPDPAEKFCYLVKSLKLDFFTNYAT